MFKKILVVARGAAPQQPAVQRAALCAGRITQLILLDVVHEPMLDGYLGNTAIYEPLRQRVVAERRGLIEALAAALEARGLEASGKALWDHPLDEAVAKQVRSAEADLVVVAPAGEGLSHGDWQLVARCPAPVLVVRGAADGKYRSIVAAVDPLHMHAKPAELDLAILAHARELQADTGAKLTAVHCHTPIEYFGADVAGAGVTDDERRAALEALLERVGIPKSAATLATGAPHEVLEGMAERGEADVIVMGVLARGRIKDWLIGSTAERVLHRARVDVLAVKPSHVR